MQSADRHNSISCTSIALVDITIEAARAGSYAAVSVIAYMIGSAVGELVILGRRPRPRFSPVSWALLAELVPICGLLACWHVAGRNPSAGTIALLVALAATAMGVQSTVAMHIHAGPTTTYVTGTLTTFATETVRWLQTKVAPHSAARQEHPTPKHGPAIYGIDWLVYAGGALASGSLFLRVGEIALVLPIAAVMAAILVSRYS